MLTTNKCTKNYKIFELEIRGRYIISGLDFETRSMVMAKFISKWGLISYTIKPTVMFQ